MITCNKCGHSYDDNNYNVCPKCNNILNKIIFIIIFLTTFLVGQSIIDKPLQEIISPTLFDGNSVTHSTLNGQVGPKINYIGNIKDFKVEMFMSAGFINPSIGIEAYPFWITLFKYKSYSDIQLLNPVYKLLMNTSINICNINISGTNYIATTGFNQPVIDYTDINMYPSILSNIQYNQYVNNYLLYKSKYKKAILFGDSNSIYYSNKYIEALNNYNSNVEYITTKFKQEHWNSYKLMLGYYNNIYYTLDKSFKPGFKKQDNNIYVLTYFPGGQYLQFGILNQFNINDKIFDAGLNIRVGQNPNNTIFTEYIIENNFSSHRISIGGTKTIKGFKISLGTSFIIENKKLVKLQPSYKVLL